MSDEQGNDLNDNEDPNAVFIKPNVELKLSADKRRECRDIVSEIKNFGVNQRQVLFLIQLLALELEDREVMTRIVGAIGEVREQVPVGNKIIVERE